MFRLKFIVLLTFFSTCLLLLLGRSQLVSAESSRPTTRMMEPEFPTLTGTLNNLSNPTWGSPHTQLHRLAPAAYADGFSEPRGGVSTTATAPNTRDISNIVSAQATLVTNSHGVSDLFWQMFQFIDHDLDLTEAAAPAEQFNIAVNPGTDPLLTSDIALSRSIYDQATGTTNARQQLNEITAWIDASNVYGSDLARSNWKRVELSPGVRSAYLITSTGNLLPIEMGISPSGQTVELFGAGDIRASEQSGLTAIHTLWMREHNRLVTRLRAENPSYTEEQLFQRARALVSAEMQIIIYNEMLPLLFGPSALPAYSGYDNTVDPSISNEFSTAAFRFGHTMLSPTLRRLDPTGATIPNGDLALRDAFFNIQWIQDEGIDSILRGLITQPAQELDPFIIDDVRSFLFAPFPGSPGSDLAALNIQRGRDHGLPTYNGMRSALGLTPAATFADITSDSDLQNKLSTAYGGDINAVDLWIAGLAEDTVAGAMVGETFHAILLDQFTRLRDGDRFWHANRDWTAHGFAADPLLDDTTALSTVRLANIIAWNTNVALANDNVLLAGNVQLFSCASVTQIPVAECEALVALYAQTGGDTWLNRAGWLETTTPCSWHGIGCLDGHIQRIELPTNNLTGIIPAELSNLIELELLYLYDNQINGTIPPILGTLSSLRHLYISGNQLTGNIPSELGNLTALEHLYLRSNALSGIIPPELGNLSLLRRFMIDNNQISGEIPSEIGNLTLLELMYFRNNQLTGAIPSTLSNLTQLQHLVIDVNQLSGEIPSGLGALTSLTHLHLQVNQLDGTLPVELNNLANLQDLNLRTNNLEGQLPDLLTNLNALTALHIDNTQLCIPQTNTFQLWLDQLSNFTSSGIVCESTLQEIYVLAFDAEPTVPSNLSPYYQPTINHIVNATVLNPQARAIVLSDLDGPADTRIFVIENGVVEPIIGLPDASGVLDSQLREFNTADGAQIGRFIKWARDTYSADKTLFSFIGHGGPLTPETEFHTLSGPTNSRLNDPLPTLPTYVEAGPAVTDAHTGDPTIPFDLLSTYDIRTALTIGTDNGANPLDVVNLVHCFAATVEELYEVTNPSGTPLADMIVASPLYAYFSPLMPGAALAALNVDDDAETLATTVMTEYQAVIDAADLLDSNATQVDHPSIITVVDTSALANVKASVDSLAANILNEFEFDAIGTRQKLSNTYQNAGLYYDSNFCAPQTFELSAPDALVDIGTFMNALTAEFAGSQFNVDLAAFAVKSAVTSGANHSAIVAHTARSGSPWFAGDLNPIWDLTQPEVAGLGLYADMGGILKNGRTVISWQYPYYIDTASAEALQFVQNGAPSTWADVLTAYWDATDLDTMACLPELPSTRSIGELSIARVLLAQGTLRINQATVVAIAVNAETIIENSLLEVQIFDPSGAAVYSDTVSTGYLLTGTHEIVMGLPFTPTVTGNYTIEPIIDVDNRVSETNEDDNQLSNLAAKRLVVHNQSGLTLDIQTAGGQEWFDTRDVDLVVTSSLDGTPINLQYMVCGVFELAMTNDAVVRVFERTHTLTFSNPAQPNFTLTLPNDVAAGRIEVQCRGTVAGAFTGRPATFEFNYAPSSQTLAGGEINHFVFTSDDSMDNLQIDVIAASGTITATIWEPSNPFSPEQLVVQNGQMGQFTFTDAYEGDYVILVEGAGDYSIAAQRDGNPGRRATTIVTPHKIQLLRPVLLSPLSNIDAIPILEIMNVSEDDALDGIVTVEIKAQRLSSMDAISLYLGGVHIADGTPMSGVNGIYTVDVNTTQIAPGQHELLIQAMSLDTAVAETRLNICVSACNPTAIGLDSVTAIPITAPLLLLALLLAGVTVATWQRNKRVS